MKFGKYWYYLRRVGDDGYVYDIDCVVVSQVYAYLQTCQDVYIHMYNFHMSTTPFKFFLKEQSVN